MNELMHAHETFENAVGVQLGGGATSNNSVHATAGKKAKLWRAMMGANSSEGNTNCVFSG